MKALLILIIAEVKMPMLHDIGYVSGKVSVHATGKGSRRFVVSPGKCQDLMYEPKVGVTQDLVTGFCVRVRAALGFVKFRSLPNYFGTQQQVTRGTEYVDLAEQGCSTDLPPGTTWDG